LGIQRKEAIKVEACFFVNHKNQNYLITAAHVLHWPVNGDSILFYFKSYLQPGRVISHQYIYEGIVYTHKNNSVDIAVIPMEFSENIKVLPLADHAYVMRADAICGVMGYPMDDVGYHHPMQRDIFFLATQNLDSVNVQLYLAEGQVGSGASGGPLYAKNINGKGQDGIIGVYTQQVIFRKPESEYIFSDLLRGQGIEYLFEIFDSALSVK